jgi:predicted dienelactone hydrolase
MKQSTSISNWVVLKNSAVILRAEPSLALGFQERCVVGVQIKAAHIAVGMKIFSPL